MENLSYIWEGKKMNEERQDLTMRPAAAGDMQTVFDLITTCDMADYGELDSSLDDLRHEWAQIDLEQDSWLLFTADEQLAGYAAVVKDNAGFSFDFYTDPAYDGEALQGYLLARCEARARAQMAGGEESGAVAKSIVAAGNTADRQALVGAGFAPGKYYFQMQIVSDSLPPAPTWPEECSLRTIVAKQDDQLVYDFIQAAFERPGRRAPSFADWRDYMMRADHFESDLWFLLFAGDELIGAALCFTYPEYGWVRQLGTARSWRRQGVGSALLQHAFRTFFQRGQQTVGLGVDSENPNAQTFYENIGMQCVRRYDEYQKTLSIKVG